MNNLERASLIDSLSLGCHNINISKDGDGIYLRTGTHVVRMQEKNVQLRQIGVMK